MADELAVWLSEEHVAVLRRTRRRELQLQYVGRALETLGLGSIALSVALPTRLAAYRGTPVENWTDAVLPEGETRTVLEGRFAVRRGDTFGLIHAIGADCAGAVTFLEPGVMPTSEVALAVPMDDATLSEAVADLPARPLGAGDDVRVSLGGLQAKLLVTRLPDGRWARPAGGAPSTHILKPDSPAAPGLVAAEAFTLRLAALAGVSAADSQVVAVDGRVTLLLERFDRVREDRTVRRVHQEDACSALGIQPDGMHKYQSLAPNSPTLGRIAEVLATHGTDVRADLTELARAVTVRTAVGDTDGHARNYSFLHRGAGLGLAPLYDAAPTHRFVATRQVGLWVAGQAWLPAITARHLVEELRSWRLPATQAAQTVSGTLERLRDALPRAAAAVPEVEPSLVEDVDRRIRSLLDGSVSTTGQRPISPPDDTRRRRSGST